MKKDKITAIILAAGQGKRMCSDVAKQYMLMKGKPILYYSLKAFEESVVDNIILVVGKDDLDYVTEQIVKFYGCEKVDRIIIGGAERYNSVYNGLNHILDSEYVLIHDGARPFVTPEIIQRTIDNVKVNKATVVGMPVKDTIKLVDKDNKVVDTPAREKVWMVQTPQAFEYDLIKKAYDQMMEEDIDKNKIMITDDAMVLEYTTGHAVQLIQGSYKNIKITTEEDMQVGEAFLS